MKMGKIYKKLVGSFILIDVFVIFCIYSGYSTVQGFMTGTIDNPEGYFRNYQIFMAILTVLLLTTSTVITMTVPKAFRIGFGNLNKLADEVRKGNVNFKVDNKQDDEFGEVIEAFHEVVASLRAAVDQATEVANGNLLIDIKPRSDVDALGIALKNMVDKNYHALSNINDATVQVMTSASQVASASESLAQGSTEQASAIQEINASIDEIAEKTKANATEANSAAELISHAIRDVQVGNQQMHEMMTAMDEINRSSESISKIIKVIDDIAFQTNILALNAAVEAARAGEAGKGFAVVAEEVRNLAAKSAQAAAETAELIEDSIEKVGVGSKIADETAKALEAITDVVKKSEVIIDGIADASNYQATAVAQVDQAINQVSQVVQTNSATSEECAAASEELSNQANRMLDLLSVFRLGATNVRPTSTAKARESRYSNESIISLGDGFGKY